MNRECLGFCHYFNPANFAYIDSVKERELLEELALLSTTTTSRSRIRPKPHPAGKDKLSPSCAHKQRKVPSPLLNLSGLLTGAKF